MKIENISTEDLLNEIKKRNNKRIITKDEMMIKKEKCKMEFTNKEIKNMCLNFQLKHGGKDYPKYKFTIKQTKKIIKIYWEYLDGECWTIYKDTLATFNEHYEIMNGMFDYDVNIKEAIQSIVYYMVTRY